MAGRLRLKDPKIIIPAIIGIVTIVVTIILGLPPEDFRVIVSPLEGTVQHGGVIQTTVTVEGLHGYNYPVIISASEQSSGIIVTSILPVGGMKPTFTSNLILSVSTEVPIGKYEITIKGLGADGKERISKYTLNVMPEIPTPTQTLPHPQKPAISITSPKEGDFIPAYYIVRGTISGELQKDKYMWVALNPEVTTGLWWPQGRINIRNGEWDIPVFLGRGKEDIGMKFYIALISVNESDDKYFTDNLKKGQETGNYLGISLPSDAEIIERVTVTRE
ncbi:MAG TPA: hypothetical protein VIO11_08755 [Candidatus Methanoperedens sp.]